MRQGTTLESIRAMQEIRMLENQKAPKGPGAKLDLGKLPVEYVQEIVSNGDGTYSVAS